MAHLLILEMREKKMKKVSVFPIILLLILLAFSKITLQAEGSTSPPETAYPWTTYRHDNRHTGYSLSIAPNTNNTLWKTYIGENIQSSPSVVNGKVFIGSSDGYLYALDQETGEITWKSSIQAGLGMYSSPAVAYGMVFIGSDDGYIYALDEETGNLVWKYLAGRGGVFSSPAVADGKVFFGDTYEYYLYCANASTGTLIWQSYVGEVWSSPAVADGKVFISADHYVNCLDENTGEVLWSSPGGYDSSPAVADGLVFADVCCHDEETGSVIWQFAGIDGSDSSPAVAYGKVFIAGCWNRGLYALDQETGDLVWMCDISETDHSSPAVADGKVFVGSTDNFVYCMDAETGELTWKYRTGGSIPFSSPAVADGKVFIGSEDGYVYAFGDLPPWTYIFEATKDSETYQIGSLSNSTISNFDYNSSLNEISFNATGPSGTVGFSNMTIPIELGDILQVLVDGSPVDYIETQNATHFFLYFTYYHSTRLITIVISPTVQAEIDITPDTLNLKSNGQWITAYIELPEEYSASGIDVSSILLNGSISVDPETPTEVGDCDLDSLPDLMVKFERAAVIALLGTHDYGEDTGKSVDVALVITGDAAGTPFEGVDTIRVLLKG